MSQQAIRPAATPSMSDNARKRRYTMSHTERTRIPLQPNSLGKRDRDNRSKQPRLSMGATNREPIGYQRIPVERINEEDAVNNKREPSVSVPTRRRSTLNRPSFIKPQTSAFENNKTPTSTRLHFDPRDIKSSEFQRRAIRSVTKYLNDAGFSPITPQSFRSLGNRTFQDIFKFLHRRLVGNPVYMKDKFEDEFIDILRSLKYPLADTISPRSLYSIAAPHSYPSFLALLLWMTEMCQVYDQYMEVDDEQAEENADQDGFEADEMNQLFFDYTVATYNAFMEGADEFSAIDQQLTSYLDEMNNRFTNELQVKTREIQQLEQELRRISSRGSAVPALQSKKKEMENDMVKFAAYCQDKERRIAKYIELNRKVTDQIKMLDTQLRTAEAEKQELQARLNAHNISETEMNELSEEQIALEREFGAVKSKVDELGRSIAMRETDIEQLKYAIDDKAASYESYRDILPPNIPEFPSDGELEVIIAANFRGRAMDALSPLDSEYMERVSQMNQQCAEARQQLDQLSRTYSDQRTELATIEMKLERKRREFEEQKKAISLEMEKYNQDAEQTEQKFTEMKSNARSQLIHNQQKETQLKVALNQLKQDMLAQKREIAHNVSMLLSELDETINSTGNQASRIYEVLKEQAQQADELFPDTS